MHKYVLNIEQRQKSGLKFLTMDCQYEAHSYACRSLFICCCSFDLYLFQNASILIDATVLIHLNYFLLYNSKILGSKPLELLWRLLFLDNLIIFSYIVLWNSISKNYIRINKYITPNQTAQFIKTSFLIGVKSWVTGCQSVSQ